MEPDLATVELFYPRLLPRMITASTADLRSDEHRHPKGRRVAGITARLAFQRAFAARVGARLAGIRDSSRTQACSTETSSSGGPSTQLVLRGKQLEIADYYTTHSKARGTWRPPHRRRRGAPVPPIAGKAAGARTRLTDPLSLPAAGRRLRG